MKSRTMVLGVKTFPNVRPDKAQAVKVLEEAAEVYAAWQMFDNETVSLRDDYVCDLLSEIADCVQALMNLAASAGAEPMDVYQAQEDCEVRNRNRGRYEDTQAQSLLERLNEVYS